MLGAVSPRISKALFPHFLASSVLHLGAFGTLLLCSSFPVVCVRLVLLCWAPRGPVVWNCPLDTGPAVACRVLSSLLLRGPFILDEPWVRYSRDGQIWFCSLLFSPNSLYFFKNLPSGWFPWIFFNSLFFCKKFASPVFNFPKLLVVLWLFFS